jgi:ribosome-associated protein
VTKREKSKGKAGPDDGSAFAASIASALVDEKAVDIKILDVRGLTDVADFLVIATGLSDRQLPALSEAAEERIESLGRKIVGTGGERNSGWMVVDTGDVVTHLLSRAMREFYDLDSLWADARVTKISAGSGKGPT